MAGIPQVITEDRASGAQVIDGSLTINGSNQYLTRTHTTSNTKTWTFSCWVKKQTKDTYQQLFTGFSSGANQSGIIFMNDDTLRIYSQGGLSMEVVTSAKYRDSGWMNVVAAIDTTQSTGSDRVKLWVNGTKVTDFGTATYPPENEETYVNTNITHYVGSNQPSSNTFYGQYAQAYFIDGQALEPTEFGFTDPLTNTWRPKKYTGTFSSGTSASSLFTSNTLLTWSSGESNWALSNSNKTATYSGNGNYSDVWSGALNGSTTYAFRLTNTGVDGNGGWLFTDSTGVSGTHPDERGSNTLGQRANETTLGAHGSFATANSVSAGQGAMSGFGDSQPSSGSQIDFVVNMSARKVWVKAASSGSWVGGGDPTNSSSTASFELPSGTIYFGSTQYSNSTVEFGDDSVSIGANSFYLPMDGNSPIGKDQSGTGNDWTPVNFGGSNSIEKATGALPILNTLGGSIARPGVFGSEVSATYTTTSASNSGGQYYFSHDSSAKPTFSFVRGATYTFDYSASSSHPLRFATAADAAGSTEYTDGTSISGNVIKFTVPHNAPDTLYYYCNAHNGMGNSISVTTDETKADPYAWKCVLAQPLVVPAQDVSNQINCTSTEKAISATAVTNSNHYNLYGGSTYMDGNGQITTPDNNDFDFGTGDFTVEIWARPNSISGDQYIVSWEQPSATPRPNAGHAGINIYNGNWRIGGFNNYLIGGNDGLVAAQWTHIAMSRNNGTLRVFVNGVNIGSTDATGVQFDCSSAFTLGKQAGGSHRFVGYLQDLRVYKGVAKYTENFIPAATNPNILPDTPSGVATKSKLKKITEGAVAFDGSGDYLRVEHDDMAMGTGDFTVEAFIYNNSHVNYRNYIGTRESGQANPAGWCIASNSGGALYVYSNGLYTNLTTQMATKRWYHVAYTRESGTHKWYVDGVLRGSDSTARDYTDDKLTIGANSYAGSEPLDGFISNVRVIKGTALYTSNFTPPTRELTNVTNTKLLCCQSPTFAVAAAVAPGTFVNDGTNYSSGSQVTGSSGLRFVDSLFDGRLSTSGASAGEGATVDLSSDNYILWTPTTGIPYTSKVEVYCYAANGYEITNYYTFNGGTETTFTGGSSGFNGIAWITVATGSGTINSIKIRITRGSGNQTSVGWYAVRVDGTILINDYNGKSIAKYGNAVATNFNPLTDDINAIRGQETGYATFNYLDKNSGATLSNGNLKIQTTTNVWKNTPTSIGMKTGKFYCEFGPNLWSDNNNHCQPGVRAMGLGNTFEMGGANYTAFYHYTGTSFFNGPGGAGTAFGSAWNDNSSNTIGVAFDADTRKVWFSKNGVWQGGGNPSAGTNEAGTINLHGDGTYAFCLGTHGNGGLPNGGAEANFGQKPFRYTPPDGFQPLSLSNVQPEKVFARPEQYIGVTLYTGSGAGVSPRTIELPHAADLVWAKSRDRSSSHQIADTVRGNNSVLNSNTNFTARNPTTSYNGGGLSIIDGKTISLVKGSTNQANNENLNEINQKGVVWSWKAGGSSNTFNIDDVGYANASDVNMNVGAFDSSTFIKGQVWSGLLSPASGAFDQDASNAFNGFLSASTRLRTSGNQVLVTMNLSSTPVTVSSQIKVHAETGYNSTCTVTVGGTTYTSSTGSIHTFNVSGSLTQMTVVNNGSGGRTYLEGMEVDGKLLVDDNLTVNSPSIANTGCSVGTEQGFSIIKYNATGSNLRVAHGLSKRPGFILLKTMHSTSGDWLVWHQSLAGVDRFMKLNATQTQAQADNVFLSIDENTFGTGDDSGINSNGQEKIAYLWHDVLGLQKFGKWTNNNSNDGTFIELGFRPALILLKNTDNVEKWYWIDSSRHTYNEAAPSNNAAGAVNTLQPNTSNTEASSRNSHTNTTVDILSNGFKIYTTNPSSGEISFGTRNYIYAAWAEAPNINLYGGQSNAR